MAWFMGKEGRTFLVEDDGTVWSVNKVIQYDPVTLLPIGKKATVEISVAVIPSVPVANAFKCNVCNREFKKKMFLANHMRSHKE